MSEIQFIKQRVMKTLQETYKDSLNSRGVIVIPSTEDPHTGTVHFNVMDQKHPDFGRCQRTFSCKEDGTVALRKGPQ